MDRWKSQEWKSQEGKSHRREKLRQGESQKKEDRRGDSQTREDAGAGKSRKNCVISMFCAGQCQTLSAFVQSAKMHLRSVLPLAHLSAFSAARETQIEFAFFFFTQVSRCQTPSAFPEAAKMQLKTALPLS